MLKNPTPRQIALLTAVLTTVLVFLAVVFINLTATHLNRALNIILIPILTFVICFFIVSYLIERFIYRRIKIIYKRISDAKWTNITPATRDTHNESESLESVEQAVEHWADSKNQEIATLKELEQYRRDYIGNVSHELKTPIFNIQGFLHTLIDGGVNDPSVSMPYLQKAARNVERLDAIVQDLENISQLESGNLVLEMQTFDIQHLTHEIIDELDLKAKKKNIRITFKEGANHGYRVRADKDRIRQVLDNLIGNSIKYGKENGQTKISFYDMDKIILIEISDNGIGIARHHLKHLFDRFYRVDKGRSRNAGGTGLGLSIAKHIIEGHNQSVHVRSTEGVGSTFGFTLDKVKG